MLDANELRARRAGKVGLRNDSTDCCATSWSTMDDITADHVVDAPASVGLPGRAGARFERAGGRRRTALQPPTAAGVAGVRGGVHE